MGRRLLALMGMGMCALGCGSPGAMGGEAARPDDPSASEALGEDGTPGSGNCTSVSPQAAPFIADWKTDQRAALDVAMQDGVAVLSYTCDGIKVLADCKLAGEYRFAEVAIKKEDLEIDQSSDLRGTLAVAAAEVSAEMRRGLKLRLAYAMIGKNATTTGDTGEIARAELSSKTATGCDGATHYVRWAWMGAFEFGTATEGSVAGSAKVMGSGAEASSASAKKLGRSDGDRGSCKPSSGDKPADRPPNGCNAIVQLQLGPVVEKATAKAESTAQGGGDQSDPGEKVVNPCSEGFVKGSDGLCKTKASASAYLCDPKNAQECVQQCEKGSGESCHLAARAQQQPGSPPSEAVTEAQKTYYEKGCAKNFWPSCSSLAFLVGYGKNADRAKARELHQKACSGGYASSCLSLASGAENPIFVDEPSKFTPSPTSAFNYTKQACGLGSSYACSLLAKRYIEGKGVMANVNEGLKTLEQSCAKKNYSACIERARFHATGEAGAEKNPAKALELYSSLCESKNYSLGCIGAGELLRKGSGAVKKDTAQAKKFLEHACNNLRNSKACGMLGEMHERGELGAKDLSVAKKLYDQACPRDRHGSPEACHLSASLHERGGQGVPKDAKLAATLYAKGCSSFDPDKTGLPEKSCRKALALLVQQKRENEARQPAGTLCSFYRDKKACDQMKKLAPPPPAPPGKGPPPPPKSPPPPPPAKK